MSLSRNELLQWAEAHAEFGAQVDVLKNDCDVIEFLLDHCEINIPSRNRYFVEVNCGGITSGLAKERKSRFSYLVKDSGLSHGSAALAYTGACDCGLGKRKEPAS